MEDRNNAKRAAIRRFFFWVTLGLIGFAMGTIGLNLLRSDAAQDALNPTDLSVPATPTLRVVALPPTSTAVVTTDPVTTAVETDTPTEHSPSQTPQPTAAPADDWQLIEPGLSVRRFRVRSHADSPFVEEIRIFRFDPNQFLFDVGYRPGEPRFLSEWARESRADGQSPVFVTNAGFFTEEMIATGLIIHNGVPAGSSYGPFAGMFTVAGDRPSSAVDVRWLAHSPYQNGENLWSGVQSFPMLVQPGGVLGFPADSDSGDRARRTAIGVDRDGYLLFIFCLTGTFTLSDLSRFLTDSGLNLDRALNLDGGSSTGYRMNSPHYQNESLPLGQLPAVIRVYKK